MDSLEGPDVAAEDRFHKIRSLTVQGGFLNGLSVELDSCPPEKLYPKAAARAKESCRALWTSLETEW